VPRAVKRNFPCVTEIDWLDDSDFEHRPPRHVRVYADDTSRSPRTELAD
jgi:hypothetical protein